MSELSIYTREGFEDTCRERLEQEKVMHVHKFLPSVGCSWKCSCGDSFIACICGACPKPKKP